MSIVTSARAAADHVPRCAHRAYGRRALAPFTPINTLAHA
jgi:hypothetical protein